MYLIDFFYPPKHKKNILFYLNTEKHLLYVLCTLMFLCIYAVNTLLIK